MSIAEVAAFVNAVAQTATRGGRCSVTNDMRCVLYDCGGWTSAMQDAVTRRFHACSVTVTPFESSVSGFIIIFQLHAPRSRLANTCAVFALLGALCIATVYAARAAGVPL
jgi:hypothetical protein